MTSLLVVRPSSLGDVVHALALVTDVVRAHPGIAIDWVAEPAFSELPAMSPHVRAVHRFALRHWRTVPFRRSTWRDVRAFRERLASTRYDAILDLQEQVKGGVVAKLARGVRHGFDRHSIREPAATLFDDVHHHVPLGDHFVTRCRKLAAAALGYAVDGPPRWSLVPPQADTGDARHAVLLHATSRDSKRWPDDRWRALIGTLAHAGYAVVLPWGSDAERERSERLANGVERASVPPRQGLASLARLLANAELAVGVDTGLTHLAAALGTPTVAVFTETDPAHAGVAIAGPHARDVGGCGRVPSLDDVQATVGEVVRQGPRC